LPDSFCTGSSIMPQKINPDVLELIRGRAARSTAAVLGLMTIIKGLPLAYHRDYQEDKLHTFAAYDAVQESLEVAIPIVQQARLRRDVIANRIERGFLDATTLMEVLIERGVPQRTAHHQVGQMVRAAMQRGCSLSEMDLVDLQGTCPDIDASVLARLGIQQAVSAFRSYGSTGPAEVARQMAIWKQKLGPP
jgi:argininosuccinate lyase